jgi:hypothetical protein
MQARDKAEGHGAPRAAFVSWHQAATLVSFSGLNERARNNPYNSAAQCAVVMHKRRPKSAQI